jgi:hypothetical protein
MPIVNSIMIKRWPKENGKKIGLNLVNLTERKVVIMDLLKIHQHILTESYK